MPSLISRRESIVLSKKASPLELELHLHWASPPPFLSDSSKQSPGVGGPSCWERGLIVYPVFTTAQLPLAVVLLPLSICQYLSKPAWSDDASPPQQDKLAPPPQYTTWGDPLLTLEPYAAAPGYVLCPTL